MQLITIKESHHASDLFVLQSKFESEGIKCFIDGELTSQVLAHIPSMMASLKIQQKDFNQAKEIMIDAGEWQETNEMIVCPKCGSEKLRLKMSLRKKITLAFSVFIALITLVPTGELYRNATYQCKGCEHEF